MPLYLTRNEQEKCVMARINRQKRRYQANFTLVQYGTWEKASRAASKWVKAILPTLPEPMSSKDRKTSRNTSGIVGVRLANATSKKDGREYPDWRWVAFWTGCPQSGGIGWSVKKYGDERAFVSAYLARKGETIDRASIDKAYARLVGTKRYASILAEKRLSPPTEKATRATKKAATPGKSAGGKAAKPAARSVGQGTREGARARGGTTAATLPATAGATKSQARTRASTASTTKAPGTKARATRTTRNSRTKT